MLLSMNGSVPVQAASSTFLALPAASSLLQRACTTGLCRVAAGISDDGRDNQARIMLKITGSATGTGERRPPSSTSPWYTLRHGGSAGNRTRGRQGDPGTPRLQPPPGTDYIRILTGLQCGPENGQRMDSCRVHTRRRLHRLQELWMLEALLLRVPETVPLLPPALPHLHGLPIQRKRDPPEPMGRPTLYLGLKDSRRSVGPGNLYQPIQPGTLLPACGNGQWLAGF